MQLKINYETSSHLQDICGDKLGSREKGKGSKSIHEIFPKHAAWLVVEN